MNRVLTIALIAMTVAACGGSATTHRSTVPRRTHVALRGPRTQLLDERAMRTQGITGSLTTLDVRSALAPRTNEFAQCFVGRGGNMRSLGGRFEFHFRVGPNGRVQEVHPYASTLGHRGVEQCLLDLAQTTRFARPHGGGPAEFTYPLEMDPARAPAQLDWDVVERVVRRNGAEVLRECRPEGTQVGFQVTAYISRRGRIVSIGAASREPEGAQSLDCVIREVRRWHLPRVHASQAKATFELR